MTLATCPKCNGSTRMPVSNPMRRYAHVIAGYRASDDTFECNNCGGQTMSGKATGQTKVDPATGLGCLHHFVGRTTSNCYHEYSCSKCGLHYAIDSGD